MFSLPALLRAHVVCVGVCYLSRSRQDRQGVMQSTVTVAAVRRLSQYLGASWCESGAWGVRRRGLAC